MSVTEMWAFREASRAPPLPSVTVWALGSVAGRWVGWGSHTAPHSRSGAEDEEERAAEEP